MDVPLPVKSACVSVGLVLILHLFRELTCLVTLGGAIAFLAFGVIYLFEAIYHE